MNENFDDILGFVPQQLTVFNEPEKKSAGDPLIYKPSIDKTKSEDGIYRATIKIIYNPFNFRESILEQQSYAMQDSDGFFTIVSSLTNNDTNCPIFKAWKKCRYAEENSVLWKQQAPKDKGGRQLFDKRFARYATIQVMEDENQPELVGKYLFWKLPKSIWDVINAKMNPTDSKKAAIPVMDLLFGRSIDLEVIPGPEDKLHPERRKRETSYRGDLSEDTTSVTYPDGAPILNDSEQEVLENYVDEMKKVWKSKDPEERAKLQEEINGQENTKELKKIYNKVLEEVKTFCPNLIEHLSYKELTGDRLERVNKWIEIVLAGNDPATAGNAPAGIDEIDNSEVETTAPSASTAQVATEDDSDLPF